jgi:hypothetical protein
MLLVYVKKHLPPKLNIFVLKGMPQEPKNKSLKKINKKKHMDKKEKYRYEKFKCCQYLCADIKHPLNCLKGFVKVLHMSKIYFYNSSKTFF